MMRLNRQSTILLFLLLIVSVSFVYQPAKAQDSTKSKEIYKPTWTKFNGEKIKTEKYIKKKMKKINFAASDGVKITADFYPATPKEHESYKSRPVIVLFHGRACGRGEYRPVAPVFVGWGFHCLAVDLRTGEKSHLNDIANETAARLEKAPEDYEEPTYADMEAAFSWVSDRFDGEILILGASTSGVMVFRMAAEKEKNIAGVISLSPVGATVRRNKFAKIKKTPVFLAYGTREKSTVKKYYDIIPSENKQFVSMKGKHGTPMLASHRSNYKPLKEFLKQFYSDQKSGDTK